MPIIKFNTTVEVEQHIDIHPAFTLQEIIDGLNDGSLITKSFEQDGFIMNGDDFCVARVKTIFYHNEVCNNFKIA